MSDPHESLQAQIVSLEKQLNELKRCMFSPKENRPLPPFPLDVLIMSAGGYPLAIPIAHVQEVYPMVLVTPLPHAPPSIRGTINYRGKLSVVLDLSYALCGRSSPLLPEMFLVIIISGERLFSLAIESIITVQRFEEHEMDREARFASQPSFVIGVLRHEQKALVLLDPQELLGASELDMLHELLADIPVMGGQST
jgi:purine-binding chemotaxis protein CheW